MEPVRLHDDDSGDASGDPRVELQASGFGRHQLMGVLYVRGCI